MTFTIEDVKRLVPEAKGIEQYSNGNIMFWLNGMAGDTSDKYVIALLTTRYQLAIAREALEEISEGAGPPDCIAQKALDAIKKEGE